MNLFKPVFSDRKAFVAYITAGQRSIEYTEKAASALVAGGVDILEIGMPFSDPIADGPIIQHAMNEALDASVTINSVLNTICNIKKQTYVPIILFTYYNPLIAIGMNQMMSDSAAAGVDGILVVDLPLEESTAYIQACKLNNIEPIWTVSPSTHEERTKEINQYCNSFLYYVCRHGTTGVKTTLPPDYAEKVKRIKTLSDKPVISGFGIGNRALAAQALKHADGFVVGSAFVDAISHGASPADLKNLAIEIDPR
ncbi:MAG: tryptophan synthase subunit alpha [Gammaproteobacteria bacterium]|nr:tryptophan synthase subunit alpha [Gammaproteobacteria bacterium]MCH9763349.1 tryptophan synthase subunit alpha [Gammaproteobacteria bacterium]